ncbi:ATP-binding protein [Streptomyces sp. AA1529]|uniref:ATP-binding protein n=1 Tax=Streptomyces sp. AA1529 TaxID=1203257 RepID=UPI003D71B765
MTYEQPALSTIVTTSPRDPTRQLRPAVECDFTVQLAATRRGARLARRLAVRRLIEWTGVAPGSDTAYAVALVSDELAANAVAHGTAPGRDIRLAVLLRHPDTLRIEVTDTRPERLPAPPAPDPEAVSGRGLSLVAAHARTWGWTDTDPYTKTVWAELPVPWTSCGGYGPESPPAAGFGTELPTISAADAGGDGSDSDEAWHRSSDTDASTYRP